MLQYPERSTSTPAVSETCQRGGTGALSDVQPGITVVVCTRDRPLQLANCLDGLARQTYPRFDVLVVDNASARPVREVCRRRGVGYVHEPVPGLTRARNLGARAARGALVAYIDDDAIPEPGWLDALAQAFADPAVAAVSGRIRYMKTRGDTRMMSDEDAPEGIALRPRGSFDQGTRDWFALACFGGIGDGGSMAFRRALIAHSIGFDERLGRGRLLEGGDEHVAFMSLIAHGYRITHAPDAAVRHPFPATPAWQRAMRLRDLRTSIAYLMFLWFEFPEHRTDIARFLYRAVRRRATRMAARQAASARLPRLQALGAMLGGPLIYWKARREWAATSGHFQEQADQPLSRLLQSAGTPR